MLVQITKQGCVAGVLIRMLVDEMCDQCGICGQDSIAQQAVCAECLTVQL